MGYVITTTSGAIIGWVARNTLQFTIQAITNFFIGNFKSILFIIVLTLFFSFLFFLCVVLTRVDRVERNGYEEKILAEALVYFKTDSIPQENGKFITETQKNYYSAITVIDKFISPRRNWLITKLRLFTSKRAFEFYLISSIVIFLVLVIIGLCYMTVSLF